MNQTIHHDWEPRVGSAPYRFVYCESIPTASLAEANPFAYQNAIRELTEVGKGLGVRFGTCYVCGTGIMHNYVCRNANGGHFVVGCECVRKLDDTRLTTEVEEAERDRQRAQRRARIREREAKRQTEWQAKREARLTAERKRNGGLTDQEIAEKQQREREAQAAADNAWLIDVLGQVPYESGFVRDMRKKLGRDPLNSEWFSGRQMDVLADIYAKTVTGGARRNSREYREAIEAFDKKIEAQK